jgi:hypothetical protein
VDRSRDTRIDRGAGRNTCRIDAVDMMVVVRCAKLVVVGGGGRGGGTGGGAGAGGAGSLGLATADGLSCGSQLPVCTFQLSGRGADSQAGTVGEKSLKVPVTCST